MGRLVALAAVALAAAVAVRWLVTRVDALGRTRPFPAVAVALPLFVAVAVGVPVVRTGRLEHRLSAVASELAGRTVTVHCAGTGESFVHAGSDLGHVDVTADGTPVDRAVLQHEVCTDLRHWLGSLGDRTPDARPDVAGAVAVHVLTHEAMHLRGLLDETAAECAAVQRDAAAARLLGAPDAQARRAARTYWLVVYPTMPEPYRTGACVPGSALDERLPDAPWADAAAG